MLEKTTIKLIEGKTIIYLGEVNDVTIYATNDFIALKEEDLDYISPDFIIKCDSGVYPSIVNFEQYICNEARKWFFD